MPVCVFCGSTSAHGAARCSVCNQPIVTSSDTADRDRNAAPPTVPISQPPTGQGWSGSTEEVEAPPPGWGTLGSSTWGSQSVTTRRSYDEKGAKGGRSGKQLRQKGPGKNASALLANARLALILVVIAVAIFLGAKYQLGGETMHIALATNTDVDFSGTVVILDDTGKELATKQVSDPGSRCPWGRLVEFTMRTPKKAVYVFAVNGIESRPLEAKTLASAKNAVTLNYGPGVEATTQRPRNCL